MDESRDVRLECRELRERRLGIRVERSGLQSERGELLECLDISDTGTESRAQGGVVSLETQAAFHRLRRGRPHHESRYVKARPE